MQSGGGKYKVKTGRRDGQISVAKNVDLPPPFVSMQDAITRFAAKGLNVKDMVHLLGIHHNLSFFTIKISVKLIIN